MNKAEKIIIAAGVSITVLVSIFANAERLANAAVDNQSGFCKTEGGICSRLTAPFKNLLDQTVRQALTQTNAFRIPTLKLYMTDGALKKMNEKRIETVLENRAILFTGPEDWVKTDLVTQTDEGVTRVKASARLKGDWGDHIKYNHKRSLRIKVRGGQTALGSSRFSIQHPVTRGYHHEALFFHAMRRLGVLTPRYFLVNVKLNDHDNGFMAFEEHFTKEMIESQNRREGPILTIDEDQLWRQRHLNINRSDVNWESYGMTFENAIHYRPNDYFVRAYDNFNASSPDVKANNAIRGLSLFRRAIDGHVSTADVFDLELTARWFALTNIFAATHGNGFHNLKFYFNPVTGRLEPIAFDGHGNVVQAYEYRSTMFVDYLMMDPAFRQEIRKAVDDIEAMLNDPEYVAEFNELQERWLKLLTFDNMSYDVLELSTIKANLEPFRADFEAAIEAAEASNRSTSRPSSDHITNRTFLEVDSPIHTYLRAFLIIDESGVTAEIKNLMHRSIDIKGVYRQEKDGSIRLSGGFLLPVDDGGRKSRHIWQSNLGTYDERQWLPHFVEFDYGGVRHREEFIVQYKFTDKLDDKGFLLNVADNIPTVTTDRAGRQIFFEPGTTILDKSYLIAGGWSVTMKPGAQLVLQDGALLRIEGNFSSLGTEERPINVQIESSARGRLGSWGGLLVVNAPSTVEIGHTVFTGKGQSPLGERQDTHGLTGCVTFYQSNVRITATTFDFMQCEDALNVIRADFQIADTTFSRTSFDAFDADFATGSLENAKFINTGNDGLDISGSTIKVSSSTFENIGDKSLSVGEASTLTADGIRVNGSKTGLASKDRSKADIRNANFDKVTGSALIAYIKKQEYGPAAIRCRDCNFGDVAFTATTQTGSTIEINGVTQNIVAFTEQNLAEVGLVP